MSVNNSQQQQQQKKKEHTQINLYLARFHFITSAQACNQNQLAWNVALLLEVLKTVFALLE